MACGTPTVATRVGGTPEVVRSPAAGVLIARPTFEDVVDGVRRLRASYPDRAATRAYAEEHSWSETTRAQLGLFRQAARSTIPDGVLSR
jgi:teichuronic acid biosynthesis glycosyltransferase TuaC